MQRAVLYRLAKSAFDRGALKGRKIVLLVDESAAFGQDRAAYFRYGYTIARTVPFPGAADASGEAVEWGRRGDLVADLVHGSDIDEIYIAVEWSRWGELKDVLSALQRVPVPVKLLADPIARDVMRYPHRRINAGWAFELQRVPLTFAERSAKRAFDVLFASLALAALFPLMLLIACAICLDSPGPILFRQTAERLQRPAVQDLQVPHHGRRGGRRRGRAGDAGRRTRDPRSAACCAARASTSCRKSSTCCAATCPLSGRARTPSLMTTSTPS